MSAKSDYRFYTGKLRRFGDDWNRSPRFDREADPPLYDAIIATTKDAPRYLLKKSFVLTPKDSPSYPYFCEATYDKGGHYSLTVNNHDASITILKIQVFVGLIAPPPFYLWIRDMLKAGGLLPSQDMQAENKRLRAALQSVVDMVTPYASMRYNFEDRKLLKIARGALQSNDRLYFEI